jgi:nucleoid DNA-binding protein
MNIKEITAAVSESQQIPASQVRNVAKAIFSQIAKAVEAGETLRLPGLVIVPRTFPAKEATGGRPARAESKGAILRLK